MGLELFRHRIAWQSIDLKGNVEITIWIVRAFNPAPEDPKTTNARTLACPGTQIGEAISYLRVDCH
jgi:hypothetical protein